MSVRVRPPAPASVYPIFNGKTVSGTTSLKSYVKELFMNRECVFCDIVAGKIPSTKIFETDTILVIKDIAPKAPIHYLILPKKHTQDLREFTKEDVQLAADLLFAAQTVAKELPSPGAFKLVSNNGKEIGQVVMHTHIHFLAGNVHFKELP